jgi:hypothetical protein
VKDHPDAALGTQRDHEFRFDLLLGQPGIVTPGDQREEQRAFHRCEVCSNAGSGPGTEWEIGVSSLGLALFQPAFGSKPVRVRPKGRVPVEVVDADEDDRSSRQSESVNPDGAVVLR